MRLCRDWLAEKASLPILRSLNPNRPLSAPDDDADCAGRRIWHVAEAHDKDGAALVRHGLHKAHGEPSIAEPAVNGQSRTVEVAPRPVTPHLPPREEHPVEDAKGKHEKD